MRVTIALTVFLMSAGGAAAGMAEGFQAAVSQATINNCLRQGEYQFANDSYEKVFRDTWEQARRIDPEGFEKGLKLYEQTWSNEFPEVNKALCATSFEQMNKMREASGREPFFVIREPAQRYEGSEKKAFIQGHNTSALDFWMGRCGFKWATKEAEEIAASEGVAFQKKDPEAYKQGVAKFDEARKLFESSADLLAANRKHSCDQIWERLHASHVRDGFKPFLVKR